MNLQLFFELLKAERICRGLNQDEMAEKVGVSKRSYCAYEAGETAPSAKLLMALAGMGVDVNYVLTGNPAPKHNKDEAIQRLKLQLQVEDDEQVAELLGLSASALADSPHIPIKAVFALAAKRPELGLDPDWIVTGISRKTETAGTLEVKITVHEMALIDRYRLSHQDVQRGVDALLAVTARQEPK